ncbi:MAG: hypothetical protein R3E89_04500 [Thiolinea sp.]
MHAMAGASVNHNLISGNVYRLLGNHLKTTPAQHLQRTCWYGPHRPVSVIRMLRYFVMNFPGDEQYLENRPCWSKCCPAAPARMTKAAS